jgi:hypothetical protein
MFAAEKQTRVSGGAANVTSDQEHCAGVIGLERML